MNPLTPRFNEGIGDGELSLIELFQQFLTAHETVETVEEGSVSVGVTALKSGVNGIGWPRKVMQELMREEKRALVLDGNAGQE